MNIQRGIGLKLAATLSTVAMWACVRGLHGAIPTGEVVFFRSIYALLPLVIWYAMRGQLREVARTRSLIGHVGRGLSGTGGMFFNYLSLAFLPLAQATAFSYSVPLFTVIFAATLLGETVRIYRWSAVAVGLGGVLVMLVPGLAGAGPASGTGDDFAWGAGAALAAAACSALSVTQIRHMTSTESPGAIVFWFAVLTTVIGAATFVFGWTVPDPRQFLLLTGCGLFGGLNQLLITLALRDAHASLLAPFEYLTMIWSVLVGFVAFAAVPDMWTVTGAAVVAAAGLFTIWREMRIKRTNPASPA